MIDILRSSSVKTLTSYALLELREIGTVKSIEAIKSVTRYRNLDIQGVSVTAIAVIADGSENKFLSELLLDKSFRAKWYAILSVLYKEDSNHSALPAVMQYSKKNYKSWQGYQQHTMFSTRLGLSCKIRSR